MIAQTEVLPNKAVVNEVMGVSGAGGNRRTRRQLQKETRQARPSKIQSSASKATPGVSVERAIVIDRCEREMCDMLRYIGAKIPDELACGLMQEYPLVRQQMLERTEV